jgi:membrane-associated protease RseP (regulator of RpoE activity)
MRRLWTWMFCAALPIAAAQGADEKKSDEPKPNRPAQAERRAERGGAEERSYWIGAACFPIDDAVRAQLGLEDDGLVIAAVVPDSPAAKAGLKERDVITAIDGNEIDDVPALMAVVEASQGKAIKVGIVRGGKPQTVEVTPAERPSPEVLRRLVEQREARRGHQAEAAEHNAEQMRRLQELTQQFRQNMPEGEARRMQEWLERMNRGEQGGPFRMHMFGPGVVVAPGAGLMPRAGDLPDDVTVTITKSGSKPVAIRVERGDEQWDIRENELDRLPAELRGPIGAILGKNEAGPAPAAPAGGNVGVVGPANTFTVTTNGATASGTAIGSGGPVEVRIQVDGVQAGQPVVRTFTLPSPNPPAAQQPAGETPAAKPAADNSELQALRKQVEGLQRQLDALPKPAAVKPATKPEPAKSAEPPRKTEPPKKDDAKKTDAKDEAPKTSTPAKPAEKREPAKVPQKD